MGFLPRLHRDSVLWNGEGLHLWSGDLEPFARFHLFFLYWEDWGVTWWAGGDLLSPSFERILFLVRKLSGISEDSDDRSSQVGSSRSPLVPHLGINLVLPQFLVPLYWRYNGFFVVTRSCRALGAEKLLITRVFPSLVSISLPNKGVGHSGTTRNWLENICPSQQ